MAERNVETEAKAVDVLVDLWDETISKMASEIVSSGGNYISSVVISNLDRLDTIERALRRLLTPLLKP